ncbi:MAG TPA: ABC transporter substrate-binding protein [Ilumatobacter sp.]|nr:ABC transporter substrate-binding protein [Ilumatobacter sp.]
MKQTRVHIAASLVAMAMVVAACGGDDDTAATPSDPPAEVTQPPAESPADTDPAGSAPTDTDAPTTDEPVSTEPAPECTDPVKLNVGSAAVVVESLATPYGIEYGFFDKYCLDVEFGPQNLGSNLMPAVLGGEAQFGITSSPQPHTAVAGGLDIQIVSTEIRTADYYLVARDGIESGADLEGKTVAISAQGSPTQIFTHKAAEALGFDPETDWNLLQTGTASDTLAAYISGAIDAAIFNESQVRIALESAGGSVVLELSGAEYPWPIMTMVTTSEWAAANEDVVVRFLKGLIEADRDFKQNFDRANEVMVKVLGQEDEEANRASWELLQGRIVDDPINHAEDHVAVIEALQAVVPEIVDFAPEDFFNNDYVERAVAELAQP